MPWSIPPSGVARESSGPGGPLSYLSPVHSRVACSSVGRLWGVPAFSPPRKLRWVLDAGCWVGALDPAPRSALRSCQPGAARCRWRLDSSLIQHPATQPSSLSTQHIQPLGAWVEAGSSRRAPGWVMYMGTGSSLGEAGWQGAGFGRNASKPSQNSINSINSRGVPDGVACAVS